ncbi:hypothetical protein GCM10007199_28860 [Fictibacillus barbaricus]|nr:hypothetical protein GCM10007199_28860 [Fictibacillus barbaricus]
METAWIQRNNDEKPVPHWEQAFLGFLFIILMKMGSFVTKTGPCIILWVECHWISPIDEVSRG